jgi:ATP-dependent DNA helicase RecQ
MVPRAARSRNPAAALLPRHQPVPQHDIHAILKALRAIERKDRSEGQVVVTSGEILLEIPDSHRIDPDASDADTKVRIAVAWLEEARLLERHENHSRVFPGSLLVANEEEARAILTKKLGADADIEPYLRILSILIQAEDDEGLSTDELMLATGKDSRTLQHMLRELDRWKLLSNDTEIGVTFFRDPDTVQRLDDLARIEDALLKLLRGWKDIETIRERRMRLARALVHEFQRRRHGNMLLVTGKQGELEAALQGDTTLADLDIEKWDVALAAALLYLNANEVLHLARGKAVFRAAMSIELNAEARRRQRDPPPPLGAGRGGRGRRRCADAARPRDAPHRHELCSCHRARRGGGLRRGHPPGHPAPPRRRAGPGCGLG